MRVYASDLHIHTCLSPCADVEMSPGNIVRTAMAAALDIIRQAGDRKGFLFGITEDIPANQFTRTLTLIARAIQSCRL